MYEYPFAVQSSCYYHAPEIFDHKFCLNSDLWSLGTCLFMILFGKPPFTADEIQNPCVAAREIKKKIRSGFNSSLYLPTRQISDDAKDLIAKLLVLDPTRRISFEEILQHSWITHSSLSFRETTPPTIPISVINNEMKIKEVKKARGSVKVKKEPPKTPKLEKARSSLMNLARKLSLSGRSSTKPSKVSLKVTLQEPKVVTSSTTEALEGKVV